MSHSALDGAAMTHCARSFTVCGTTDYMAPETIRGIGSGYSADWCASCAFRNRPRVLQSCQCR
jgi:serine/threonine protein kinase